MHPHQLFADNSDIYAASRPTYPAALYEYLVSLCPQTKSVWDAACGTGQAAVDLSRYFTQVAATDISLSQIEAASQRPNIDYSVQPAEATTFPDNAFDCVCVAQALHWFNFDLFWPEVKRVLKPNGLFAAWGYAWFTIALDIDTLIKTMFLDVVEPFWASQNQLLWNLYREVSLPFSRIDPPAFMLQVNWNLAELFSYLHSWSASRRCMAAQGTTFFDDAYTAVASKWGDVSKKRQITMDFCLLVGRNE